MAPTTPLAGVILAAGKGTRMKSDMPKCLHPVGGVPMAELVGRAMKSAGVERPVVVIGVGGKLLEDALGESYQYVWQHEQLGTGHAVQMAQPNLSDFKGSVLICAGDTPLLSADILTQLVQHHHASQAQLTLATAIMDDPTGYGRVVRHAGGGVLKVVEQKDASDIQRQIREVNTGVYCVDAELLFETLPLIKSNNASGEFYLTDVVEALANAGHRVEAVAFDNADAFQGVNDRWQLAQAANAMRQQILKEIALSGVTIVDPASTYISIDAKIGVDTSIHPNTIIDGHTVIGRNCQIGPNSVLHDAQIDDECTVLMSHVNRAVMRKGSRCGPFAHLRPLTEVGPRAKIGNFVELKNAQMGEGAAANHLAYLGDCTIGANANIGAGTITCNYDGFRKHRTTIGDNVFVGSNSTLVAPITLGGDSFVAAGSVITHDVSAWALALGRARQVEKPEWVRRLRSKASEPK